MTKTTIAKTIPRYKLSSGGSSNEAAWRAYAMKQRIEPAQRSKENPPNSCLQNLTHSGVVGGGDSLFKPYLSMPSIAAAFVFPYRMSVLNLLQRTSTSTMWMSTSSSCFRSWRFRAEKQAKHYSVFRTNIINLATN